MAKMDASNSTLNNHVKFNDRGNRDNRGPREQRGNYNPQYQPRRAGLNINHVKFDLLKISELYDGVLTADLGHLPLDFYNQYLTDLCKDGMIYGYSIDLPELRTHEASGDRSFTYTIYIQSGADRASKALKIHVGLYKSAWAPETVHTEDGLCCMPKRLVI
jgi:hypothetical protein